jgi:hypothetical protein
MNPEVDFVVLLGFLPVGSGCVMGEHIMANEQEVGGVSAELSYKLPISNLEAKLKVNVPLGRRKSDGVINFASWRTKRLAKHDAKRNEPPTESPEHLLSEREAQVEKARLEKSAAAEKWLNNRLEMASAVFAEMMPAKLSSKSVMHRMAALIKGYLDDASAELRDKRSDYLTSEKQLEQFRTDHDLLKRDAKVPATLERPIAILLCAFVVEGMVNGLLFMEASPQGFIGGLIVAFALSLFNVGAGLALGWFGIRNLFHIAQIRRVIGGVLAGVFFLFGVFVNLFVAHFRDRAESELQRLKAAGGASDFSLTEISMSGVFGDIFPNPLNFETLHALVLLGLGVIVFGLATYEGVYGFRDRYPDYGDYWLTRNRAKRNHRDVIAANRSKIRRAFESWRQEISKSKADYQNALALSDKVMIAVGNWVDTARSFMVRSARDANMHFKLYRDTNAKLRRQLVRKERPNISTAPAHYFTDLKETAPLLSIADLDARKSELDSAVGHNLRELAQVEAFLERLSVEIESYLQEVESREDTDLQDIRESVRKGADDVRATTSDRSTKWSTELQDLLAASA